MRRILLVAFSLAAGTVAQADQRLQGKQMAPGAAAANLAASGNAAGSTTTFATTNGALVTGHCAQYDGSSNLVDSGVSCLGVGAYYAPLATVYGGL